MDGDRARGQVGQARGKPVLPPMGRARGRGAYSPSSRMQANLVQTSYRFRPCHPPFGQPPTWSAARPAPSAAPPPAPEPAAGCQRCVQAPADGAQRSSRGGVSSALSDRQARRGAAVMHASKAARKRRRVALQAAGFARRPRRAIHAHCLCTATALSPSLWAGWLAGDPTLAHLGQLSAAVLCGGHSALQVGHNVALPRQVGNPAAVPAGRRGRVGASLASTCLCAGQELGCDIRVQKLQCKSLHVALRAALHAAVAAHCRRSWLLASSRDATSARASDRSCTPGKHADREGWRARCRGVNLLCRPLPLVHIESSTEQCLGRSCDPSLKTPTPPSGLFAYLSDQGALVQLAEHCSRLPERLASA